MPSRIERPDLAEEFAVTEQVQHIERALGCLTVDQQAVIVLRHQGYRFDEMAEFMDRTEGATKALQHRAFQSLRSILEVQDKD